MSFTKITAAGIGSTETVTIDGLSVINDGSFGGNVSVAGTLTYEDVTNIDSVGLITARAGVVVGSGITLSPDGDIFFTGIITGNGSALTGVASTENIRTNTNATFLQNINVSGTTTATSALFTGAVDASNGITLDDAITHRNDTNTKIRFPTDDTVSFETAGSERIRIGSSGQIGIGGANYGTSGQVLTSGGSGSAVSWTTPTTVAITSIATDGVNRVLTSDGDGTATAHSFVTIENNRLSINRGSGSGAYPLIARRTDASGIIAEFANNGGYGLWIGQNSATGEAYLRTGTGQPLVFTTNSGSGITNERLRISSNGDVTTTGASYSRANAGFTARKGDSVNITRASGTPLEINRTGNNTLNLKREAFLLHPRLV